MKKWICILLLLSIAAPITAYAGYDIDLALLSNDELKALVQDATKELLQRVGFSYPSPAPTIEGAILADDIALEIKGGRLYTRYDTLTLQITVKNNSDVSTVDAFDFDLLAFNAYGEQVYTGIAPDAETCMANNLNIKPGKTYSAKEKGEYWTLYTYDAATEVHVSITRYHIKDGATIVVPDDQRVWVTFKLE